jgi:hypothetical protein
MTTISNIEKRLSKLEGRAISPDIDAILVASVLHELSDFDLDALFSASLLHEQGKTDEEVMAELTDSGMYENYVNARKRFDDKYKKLASAANLLSKQVWTVIT